MHNEFTAIGYVGAIVTDQRGTQIVIVHDASNPKYPVDIPCRFWSETAKTALEQSGVKEGDLVRVRGSVRGREHEGRWYTDADSFQIKKLRDLYEPAEKPAAKPAAKPSKPAPSRQPGADDDIPF